ncbi:hypothetical protein [Mycobacterium stomatepiae]|uniref:Apea-like HEPN domain-containing protein n=1 Tax=Mycobacterium stomatepiae TaxID=470076 RepID=A0A7I7QFS1_9MYCO|nr:hypothetical protein [Mycobacterium stomatepiae]MCV7167747.1 hypothetical protein [Mycobacterium stomatepiae]BBY25204.1 hypothetical protein MSTO_54090 [Mycobacterium stomatepiae]
MNPNITGFYHDPPVFLGERPVDESTKQVFFDRFNEAVLRTTLHCGLEFRASVEGLIAFDFTTSENCATPMNGPHFIDDFDVLAEKKVRQTRIMNTYLAFFYTRHMEIDQWTMERMVVSPATCFSMHSLESGIGGGSPSVFRLAASSFAHTYAGPPFFDMRILNRPPKPVSAEVVQNAANDLSTFIDNHGDEGILLIDLFLRASIAFQDHNHSLSLTSSWTVIEKLINDLWRRMQQDHQSRQGEQFIDAKRRERLQDGRTFTASVMSEMLSFMEYIPKDLYDDVSKVRVARNKWMHSLKSVNAQEAMVANSVCERFLKEVMGVTLIGATGRTLRG